MKVATTSERLKQILSERHIRQIDIIEAAKPYSEKYNVKLNKNDLSQYVSGKTEPGQSKLSILGMALNVNEAWLMGLDVPMERKSATTDELMILFNSLDDNQRNNVIDYIQFLKSKKD